MLTSATLRGGIDIKNCSMNRSSRAHLVDHCIIFTRNQGIAITVLSKSVNVRANSVCRANNVKGTSPPSSWITRGVSLENARASVNPERLWEQKRSAKRPPTNTFCRHVTSSAGFTNTANAVVTQAIWCRVTLVLLGEQRRDHCDELKKKKNSLAEFHTVAGTRSPPL